MNLYLWLKLVHIISATVVFGTGIGIAFFMLRAAVSGNEQAMRVTVKNVVLADWIFTTPAVIVQFVTGIWLTLMLNIPMTSLWFVSVIALFLLVGACWLPVVRIQIKIRDALEDEPPGDYQQLMKTWFVLGVLAFLAILVIFYLMVTKAGMNTLLVQG